MAKVWHVVIGGKQYGPLSNSDLKSLADTGKLTPHDHVWKEGLPEWIPASKIKGLFPPRSATPSTETCRASASNAATPAELHLAGTGVG